MEHLQTIADAWQVTAVQAKDTIHRRIEMMYNNYCMFHIDNLKQFLYLLHDHLCIQIGIDTVYDDVIKSKYRKVFNKIIDGMKLHKMAVNNKRSVNYVTLYRYLVYALDNKINKRSVMTVTRKVYNVGHNKIIRYYNSDGSEIFICDSGIYMNDTRIESPVIITDA